MKTFLLPGEPVDKILKITGEDFHYLCHVRRHNSGDQLRVKTPGGEFWNAVLRDISDKSCSLEMKELLESIPTRHRDIELYFCLPKGKKGDLIVRQAAEAEVRLIQPLTSDHSLVKIRDEKDSRQKLERWKKILREALQQSGSLVETEVLPPKALKSLDRMDGKDVFFLHQISRLESDWTNMVSMDNSRPVVLLIGPEGGFSDSEVLWMESKGYIPVFLGNTVLRAETAALFAVAAVRCAMGEF